MSTAEEIRRVFAGLGDQAEGATSLELTDAAGNAPWPELAYPNRLAPIIRHAAGGGLEVAQVRWGMPTPPQYLKTKRDPGVTNVRNTRSPHWRRWLRRENRCLVPLGAFNEGEWLEPVDPGLPMAFAGIETRGWRSVRKVAEGETEDDLFAFLTTVPSAEVAAIHEKAMPVILTTAEEWRAWLTLPWAEAAALQRPLPNGALRIVREDGGRA